MCLSTLFTGEWFRPCIPGRLCEVLPLHFHLGLCAVALADTFPLTAEAALFKVDRVDPTSNVAAVVAKGKGSRLLLLLPGRSTLMSRAHHTVTVFTIQQ